MPAPGFEPGTNCLRGIGALVLCFHIEDAVRYRRNYVVSSAALERWPGSPLSGIWSTLPGHAASINVPTFYLRLFLEEEGRQVPAIEDEDDEIFRMDTVELLVEAKAWVRQRARIGFDNYAFRRSGALLKPLVSNVTSLPHGKAAADRYHKAVAKLLTNMLYPFLTDPKVEHEIHGGRKRIDITFRNVAKSGFFHWLGQHYRAPQIFVECKNYVGSPKNPELDQLSGRFSKNRGEVGLLVCRTFGNRSAFLAACRDTADDGRGYVIGLEDRDLRSLVTVLASGDSAKRDRLLQDRFNDLVN